MMAFTCSGWGSGAQQQTLSRNGIQSLCWIFWAKDHQTHYWALRQQARGTFTLVGVAGRESRGPRVLGAGGERFLLLPRFGGGVWCLICG